MYDEREFWRIEAETNSIRHNIINLIFLLDTSGSMVRQADKRSECRNVRFD